jgi:hypothetical protein
MSDDSMTTGFQGLLNLINAANKKSVQKICRELVIDQKDLYELIISGKHGLLSPYSYACHFSDYTPAHLFPTQDQLSALNQSGIGIHAGPAKRAITRLFQSVKERRMFAAHLFYLQNHEYWSLFYFDQRDISSDSNHWKIGGPHIHYAYEAFANKPMHIVWQEICQLQASPPSSEHIRYKDRDANGG